MGAANDRPLSWLLVGALGVLAIGVVLAASGVSEKRADRKLDRYYAERRAVLASRYGR